jgi:hypothetical protein
MSLLSLSRRLVPIVFAFLLAILPSSFVLAIDNPDSISIESVRVFGNLLETGDALFVVEFKVMYASEPDEDAIDAFFIGVWDGAVKGPSRGIYDYQHGVRSIYLTAAQFSSFTYTWGSEYTVRVVGNPTYFPIVTEGINRASTTLSPSHWLRGATSEMSREYLALWIEHSLGPSLGTSWGIPLLTETGKLNSLGSVVFREAIPGLSGICPDLFAVSSSIPSYTTHTPNKALEDVYLGRRGPGLSEALGGIEGWITGGRSTSGNLIGAFGIMLLYFILAGRIFLATNNVAASIAISIQFFLAGTYVGALPVSYVFIAAFLTVVMFGITFILGRL